MIDRLRARFLAAQLAGARQQALAVVTDALAEGVPAGRIALEVVQPAQYEVGRLWEENRITVADEHLATAIAQLALARLYPELRPAAANGRSVLVACVEGEQHGLGARVAADLLEEAGFTVHFLGADVPTEALVAAAHERRPDLIALSVAIRHHLPALEAAVVQLRQDGYAGCIVAGGHAVRGAPDLLDVLELDGTASDGEGLVALARSLLGLLAAPAASAGLAGELVPACTK